MACVFVTMLILLGTIRNPYGLFAFFFGLFFILFVEQRVFSISVGYFGPPSLCRSLWFVNDRCLILADIWGSIVVMICVTMTLVDVMGYMHFWGLTIDVVSSVIIIISIGLCVDYSAHIAHAFLSVQGAILPTYLLFFAHCSKI